MVDLDASGMRQITWQEAQKRFELGLKVYTYNNEEKKDKILDFEDTWATRPEDNTHWTYFICKDAPAPEKLAAAPTDFEVKLDAVLAEVRALLLAKNTAYGDSALNPVRIFSKSDAVEQIKVRIDDKICRLQRGSDSGEDTTLDLMGYLVMLRIATKSGKDC